jgi:hypothetical protein
MNISCIVDLYNDVQKFGIKHQKKYGQSPVKLTELDEILLKTVNDVTGELVGEWNPDILEGGDLYRTITDKVLDLPETMCSGRGNTTLIYKNHLMIEIFRIPTTCEPSLGQLLRIALYTGLLNSSLRKEEFPDGIVHTYKSLDLSAIVNFMRKESYQTWDPKNLQTTLQETFHSFTRTKTY